MRIAETRRRREGKAEGRRQKGTPNAEVVLLYTVHGLRACRTKL
jgi:hypothetical protein